MDMNLKIDPEFQNKIPPLTEAEFAQLEENILSIGMVSVPIIAWHGTIVDGHHRYKIIQKHPEVKWSVVEMEFPDKWAAFDWMYKNQLGRRNLTDEQKMYLLGKLYEARKHVHGTNQFTVERSAHSEHSIGDNSKQGKISRQIAKEQNVGVETVKRAEHFAKGIDAIRNVEPKIADAILMGEKKVKKIDIQQIGKANHDERKSMIESVAVGDRPTKPPSSKKREGLGATKEARELSKAVNEIINGMADDTPMEYTIDNLTEQIGFNADSFVGVLSNLIMDHKDICDENRFKVIEAIDSVIRKIIEIKRRLNDGTQL